MQEALHRLDAKVSHIYHNCNALAEKTDIIAQNQSLHMHMKTASATVALPLSSPVATAPAAVVTPEPPRKKPRLLTLYYSPTSLHCPSVSVCVYILFV